MAKANKPPRLILCLSDLHCGSTVGLLPPGFRTIEGNVIGQTKTQQWLWDRWKQTHRDIDKFIDGRPFVLVVNGDAIEGCHHRSTQVISPEPGDHLEAAFQCLQPIAERADRVYVVTGTEAHTANREQSLASRLGAVGDEESERFAWDQLNLDVAGVRIRFVHHISTTSREWLRASRLSIHISQARLAAINAGHKPPDVLVAGHCHIYDHYQSGQIACLTLPAWQFLTRYGHKVVPGSVPSVGAVVLDCTEPGLPRVRPFIHAAWEPKGVSL